MGKTIAVKPVPTGINPEVAVITMVVNAAVNLFYVGCKSSAMICEKTAGVCVVERPVHQVTLTPKMFSKKSLQLSFLSFHLQRTCFFVNNSTFTVVWS